ncbi:MAG: M48 family metalloprotease [Kiritimatiellaeota bacterium]|nr:M48 family metalloprotease [Kiritimatiellota bacterium]
MWELIQANRRKSALLIVLLAGVLIGLGYLIGFSLDAQIGGFFGVAAATLIWVVLTLTGLLGGERLLLATAGAREVTHTDAPQLFNVVEEMQIAAGLSVTPRVFIIDNPAPNAFAVGLNPERAAVAVTTGLLARLNHDELQGVIAHELGHIANRDTLFMTLAGVTVGAIIMLADLYVRGLRFGGGRGRRSSSERGGGQGAALMMIVALVFSILAPLLAQILYFACSRRREYLADASSAQFTRYPEGLASALGKIAGLQGGQLEVSRAVAPMFIVNPLAAAGSAANVFSTHPATEDRIRVLRGLGQDASFAAYEAAYRQVHAGHGVIGARSLGVAAPAAVREPSAATPAGPGQPWRAAHQIMQQASNYCAIPCACGVTLKVPADFGRPRVACPKCGTVHPLPPGLGAGAEEGRT